MLKASVTTYSENVRNVNKTLISTENYSIINIEKQRQENESKQTRMLNESPLKRSLNQDNLGLADPPVLKSTTAERQCSSQERLQNLVTVKNIEFSHSRRKSTGKSGGLAQTSLSEKRLKEVHSTKSMSPSRRVSELNSA